MVMITQEIFQELISPPVSPVRPLADIREWVQGRDSFQCQAPGCQHREGLEVHQIYPTQNGGQHNPANLITLCSICYSFWDLMGRGPLVAGVEDSREGSRNESRLASA